jgi:hypothetical protein
MISTPQRISGLLSGSGLLAATLLTVGGSSAAVVSSAAAGPIPLAQNRHLPAEWRHPYRGWIRGSGRL